MLDVVSKDQHKGLQVLTCKFRYVTVFNIVVSCALSRVATSLFAPWLFPLSGAAYFDAGVYVGMWPLPPSYSTKQQICKPEYMRTVLCASCAPKWLSTERDDVTTQLCAHCERPIVSRFELSELRNAFCSGLCKRTYYARLRNQPRQ